MEVKTYNKAGDEAGKITLSEKVFEVPYNGDLVHQVLTSLQSNARILLGKTKDRSEVRGGGIKPWRQKGTGRARHGSNRSPIWVGGGITHGPTSERNFKKKINTKMKKKAFFAALSAKLRDGQILFVEDLSFDAPKANEAKTLVKTWEKVLGDEHILSKKKNSVHVFVMAPDKNTPLSFRNFKNITVSDIKNANLLDILSHKYVVIANPKESVAFLEERAS